MMLTRRRFLGSSGAGVLAFSAGCLPPAFQQLVYGAEVPPDALQQEARLKGVKNRLLGYPINMNTPSEEFFAWRAELLEAGIDHFAFNNGRHHIQRCRRQY